MGAAGRYNGEEGLPAGDADFGDGPDDDAFVPGVDFDLADRPDTCAKVDIGYSKNSKFVDVKLVKKHLWDCISEDIEDAKSYGDEKKLKSSFQELVRRTVKRMPKAECENLSVAVCFICALHLCNEKGIELKVDEERILGDFAVVDKLAPEQIWWDAENPEKTGKGRRKGGKGGKGAAKGGKVEAAEVPGAAAAA